MKRYLPETYGDHMADLYDNLYPPLPSTHAMFATLARLAGTGSALELGIGTGRVALPLFSRGVKVHGIDASEVMVNHLRRKPGGATIPVTVGDMADVGVDGRFSLIYVVCSTFFVLLSQEEQLRCIANCAAHLEVGGAFLIEAFYPHLTHYMLDKNVSARRIEMDGVSFDVTLVDQVQQRLTGQYVIRIPDGIRTCPLQIRYAWPSEIDLMARVAGLRLESRTGGWQGEAYTSESGGHISVYRHGTRACRASNPSAIAQT